jgi:hypothetical protein
LLAFRPARLVPVVFYAPVGIHARDGSAPIAAIRRAVMRLFVSLGLFHGEVLFPSPSGNKQRRVPFRPRRNTGGRALSFPPVQSLRLFLPVLLFERLGVVVDVALRILVFARL